MKANTQNHKMKRAFWFALLPFVQFSLVFSVHAQQNESVAAATPRGIFIYLGRDISKQSYYEVEVKTDKGVFSRLAVVRAPQDRSEMEARLKEFQLYFENLDHLTKVEEEKLWNHLKASTSTDQLYIPNLPLMHLASGTAYLDNTAVIGKEYQYRIKFYKPDGTLIWQRETNKTSLPAKPDILKPQFREKRESSHQLLIQWFVPQQRKLSSYQVFRRVYGLGEFQKVNVVKGFNTNQDSVFFIVIDSVLQQPAHYEYYIMPVDAYGNPGPVSEPVGAGTLGNKYIPVLQNFRGRSTGKDHAISLSWRLDTRKYLRSLEIHRSMYFDSAFVKIAELPPADTSYTDHLPQGAENYYYFIVVNGPFGNSYPSAVISALYHDAAIPEAPVEIAAETVDRGIRIHWTYQEPYVKGFFVYRSEFPDKDFKVISGLVPFNAELLSHTDTSKALMGNQAYYYAVETVSDSDVHSKLSVAVNGLPGVKTKISTPRNVSARWTGNEVMITWDDLQETEGELQGYSVFRKIKDQEFRVIADGSLKNYFQDAEVKPGETYVYAVQARDFFGGKSSLSEPFGIQIPVSRPTGSARITLSATGEGIHIAWSLMSLSEINNLRLYRQEPGQSPKLIVMLEKDQLDYVDKSAERGKLYSYFLTTVNLKNVESSPGQLATLRY